MDEQSDFPAGEGDVDASARLAPAAESVMPEFTSKEPLGHGVLAVDAGHDPASSLGEHWEEAKRVRIPAISLFSASVDSTLVSSVQATACERVSTTTLMGSVSV